MSLYPETTLLDSLQRRFGFTSFRVGQSEVISSVLAGRDVLAVMPTGGGKSMGYALPALLLGPPVLVVSPLIALMKDQVDSLTRRKIAASFVNSTVAPAEQMRRLSAFRQGRLRLLFVAPERFRSERFLAALEGFRPGLFAVDEAHCISEWGHDFRPDYLRLRQAAESVGRPPILALTATATAEVRGHIAQNLGLRDPVIIVKGFERPNLDFAVARTASRADKLRLIEAAVAEGRRGIVYAATRKNVQEVAMHLREAGFRAGFYHAGLSDSDRIAVQERFADGQLPVVVATNAFGMGIDRPDLRFVTHFDLPGSVEAYTQEAGRAGRDDLPSRCVLLYQPGDARLPRFFIGTSYPDEAVIRQTRNILRSAGDSVTVDEESLAQQVSEASHPRAVDSALRILAEHGLVARGFQRDSRTRAVRFLADRPVDYELIRLRAERDFTRLRHIIDYAERAGCHRAYLVDYFAGAGTAEPCGACEGCRSSAERRELTDGERKIVSTLLQLVQRLDYRYGRRKLTAVLSGSRKKDILEKGLDRLPDYSRLGHLPTSFVDRLMEECLSIGLLKVDGGQYPVVGITSFGRAVLGGEESAHLRCFDDRKKKRPPSKGARSAATGPATPPDSGLVERLRRWRNEQAQRRSVPAYCIISNKTIDELASRVPGNDEELLGINGIGPAKVERFGAAILDILGNGNDSQ